MNEIDRASEIKPVGMKRSKDDYLLTTSVYHPKAVRIFHVVSCCDHLSTKLSPVPRIKFSDWSNVIGQIYFLGI